MNAGKRFYYITADRKMKKGHRSSWKCVHHAEDDFEEWTKDVCWDPQGPSMGESSTESTAGRNPANSSRREWYVMTEEDYEGMGGSWVPTYSQVLQGQSNKIKRLMTCPPVIVSDSNQQRFSWEDKPTVVMKITKRKRCKRNKDAPKDVSAPQKEDPGDAGLMSDTSLIQDGRRSEDREANCANEMETTGTCTSGVSLREEDTSETAETQQTTVEEEEPNIWQTTVQQLDAEQMDIDVKDHKDSGACDKNQVVIVKNNISEIESCNRGLQEEDRQRIHQLDGGRHTLKFKKTNFESRVQQQTEDKQHLSHSYNASPEKLHQLEGHSKKVSTKIAIHNMLVFLVEDKKTEGTEEKQSVIRKDKDLLLIENITDKGEKMEMQLHQLQQQESPLEDVCGGRKKKGKKRFPSIFFSKASKMEKEATAETEAETEMIGGEVKKKRRQWSPLIFFSKASKIEKEAMEERKMMEGEVQRGALLSRC